MRAYHGKREFKSLKTYKREKIKIAKELGYRPKCIEKITKATSTSEIDSILRTERLR